MASRDLVISEGSVSMKPWMWVLMALVLTGCMHASANQPIQPNETGKVSDREEEEVVVPENYPVLEDLGPAPELENEVWLNSEESLRLSDLRGEVVLLDMWTFG